MAWHVDYHTALKFETAVTQIKDAYDLHHKSLEENKTANMSMDGDGPTTGSSSYVPDVPESKHFLRVNEKYFTAYVDCSDRTASFIVRDEKVDTGNYPRPPSFYYSNSLPKKCQPLSLRPYHSPIRLKYDRGHEADSNSYDFSPIALHRGNYMYTVAPQIAQTNRRGSWRRIEKIMECYRIPKYIGHGNSIRTIAGVVWGDNPRADLFLKSHGQKIPAYYFKIVVFHENGLDSAYAWLVQNEHVETKSEAKNIDAELVTVNQLVQMTGYNEIKEYVPKDVYFKKAVKSPPFLRGCDES